MNRHRPTSLTEVHARVAHVVYFALFSREMKSGLKDHQLHRLLGGPEVAAEFENALRVAVADPTFDFATCIPGDRRSPEELRDFATSALVQVKAGRAWLKSRDATPRPLYLDGRKLKLSASTWFGCRVCRDRISAFGFPSLECECGNVQIEPTKQLLHVRDVGQFQILDGGETNLASDEAGG